MRLRRIALGLTVFLLSGACLADNGPAPGEDPNSGAWDKRVFIRGSTVTVLLNYDQFVESGILENNPTLTRKNVESAVQMAIDRWAQVTSLNLRINYGGLTTKTDSDEGEIVIGAWTHPDQEWRWASATPSETPDEVTNGNCSLRFFKFTSGEANDWFVFNFKDYPSGAIFIHAALMHEFGHCLGLHHNPQQGDPDPALPKTLRTVMEPSATLHASWGPYIEDVEDIVAMYGTRGRVQFDVVRSTNDGLSWSSINPSMPILGITQTPVLNRDNDRMMMFFTDRNHHPAYIKADHEGRVWDSVPTPVNNVRTLYGSTGSGNDNEYMWAWVDPYNNNDVTLLYTSDAGAHWDERSPGIRSAGAPSVRKIDNDTWVLSYVYLDLNTFKNENGRVLTIVSSDDGRSWGPPHELGPGLRTIGGVSVTSLDRTRVRVGFARISELDDRYTTSILTIAAHLAGSTGIVRDNWVSSGSQASTSEVSFTTSNRVFVQAYETPGKRLTSCNSAYGTAGWQTCASVNPFTYRGVPPAVGAKTNSNWVYMVKER